TPPCLWALVLVTHSAFFVLHSSFPHEPPRPYLDWVRSLLRRAPGRDGLGQSGRAAAGPGQGPRPTTSRVRRAHPAGSLAHGFLAHAVDGRRRRPSLFCLQAFYDGPGLHEEFRPT